MRNTMSVVPLAAFVLLMVLPYPATAQATRPASAGGAGLSWPETVSHVSTLLVGRNVEAVKSALAGMDLITQFGSNSPETTDHLIGATTGGTVLGSHAYLRPPTTIASDLASDLRDTDDVPAGVKRQFVPADDAAARRA